MTYRKWCLVGLLAVGLGCGDDAMPDTDAGPDTCATNADCDDGVFCNGSETCDPSATGASSIGCVPAAAGACMEGQTCDEEADTCSTICELDPDADGDGVNAMECGGDDCDDSDERRFPGNTEVCDVDGVDEDCDETTFGSRDIDRDGQIDATCCNGDNCGTDCDDLRASVSTTGTEACDGFDNDCDGVTDEGVLASGFADTDGDQHGDPDAAAMACPGTPRFSDIDDDCDDEAPPVHGAQVEVCDSLDNDCDGSVDENTRPIAWYRDSDGDGFGNAAGGVEIACAPPAGYSALGTDCDDERSGVNPAAVEICDGRDNDCNGIADFRIGPNDFEDDDRDGFTDVGCSGLGDDCDDTDPNTGPGATEICDGRDNDCDGTIDEDAMAVDWFRDVDGDGYGEGDTAAMSSCEPPAGHVRQGGDCDDSNPNRSPGAPDRCDGVDDDCDGTVDEAALEFAFFGDADGDGAGGTTPVLACAIGVGLGLYPSDCDDDEPAAYPGADELCDGIDNDCDSNTDEGGDALCSGPMATGTCESGGCNLTCTPPFLDCDGNGLNGCEVDPRTDADHCNGCGNSCGTAANGSVMCVDSACELSCDVGFEDCSGGVADGCETSLADDPLNCGTCSRRCQSFDNETAICAAMTCDTTCDAGFDDCDGEPTNGCESRLASDPANCGGCGMTCAGAGAACVSSNCYAPAFPSDGSDGAFMPTVDTMLPAGVYQYTDVVIPVGVTVTTNGTGVLEIRASGEVRIDGVLDVSGGVGASSLLAPVFNACGASAGGVTGDPTVDPSYEAGSSLGCPGGGLGGSGAIGGTAMAYPGQASACDGPDSAGRYGGGQGGGIGSGCRSSGAGGGGYAGGGGGTSCVADAANVSPGGNGASFAGASSGGTGGTLCARPGGGEPGFGAYSGGDGFAENMNWGTGGGGGSIGRDAAADLAVTSTFRPGSGGGGGGLGPWPGGGGGGGGGALRLSSTTRIVITGRVLANGGNGGTAGREGGAGGAGSGGLIYLAAPAIQTSGELSAAGGDGGLSGGLAARNAAGGDGGLGRIRLSVDPSRCALGGIIVPALASDCSPTMPAVTERVYIDTYPF